MCWLAFPAQGSLVSGHSSASLVSVASCSQGAVCGALRVDRCPAVTNAQGHTACTVPWPAPGFLSHRGGGPHRAPSSDHGVFSLAAVTESNTTTGDGVRFHTAEDSDGSCHRCPRGALRQAPGDAKVPPEVQPCTRTRTQVQDRHVRREQHTGPRGQRERIRTDVKTSPPLKSTFPQDLVSEPDPKTGTPIRGDGS